MVKSNLLEIRTEKGCSQLEIADAAGVSTRAIRNIEYETNPPSMETALRLAAYLGVSVETLFTIKD